MGTKMQPRNQLFATLDVTCHGTKLPGSNLNTVFIDTVGFISDIPTALIASFSSTLEDALDADLLLHVEDVSHPDHLHQASQVHETLRRLGVGQRAVSNMVTVGNKIDLNSMDRWVGLKENGLLPISAKAGHGLAPLMGLLEEKVISCTNRLRVRLRLRLGSEEWDWVARHASIG